MFKKKAPKKNLLVHDVFHINTIRDTVDPEHLGRLKNM